MDANLMVWAIVGGLGLLAVATIVGVIRKSASILRTLQQVDDFLVAIRSEAERADPLVHAVREHVVTDVPGQKIVLSRPLPALRHEFAEDELAHSMWFSLGSLLTGLALVATFLLIALAMRDDVSGAIRESAGAAGETSSTRHLASAVELLGGKFFISATGVAGSVLAILVTNWCRGRIFRIAEHPGARLMAEFTSIEAQQLALQRSQHVEVCGLLGTVATRIDKLNSIEVSLKGIGNDVSANLKLMMRQAIGEEIKSIIADTMIEVAKIAERVEHNLTDSFGAELQGLSQALQGSLAAVQKSIEGQAQGQLDKILERLQDAVSGGFQTESHKMVAALEQFAQVVPALEQQLRAMTGRVAEESRVQSETAAQMYQVLMQRMSTLVEAMTAQQAANAEAIERMQNASEQGAAAVAQRLEVSGAGLVSSVLGASRGEIEAIAASLRDAAEASARRYADLDTQAGGAAAAVADAATGLTRSAQVIAEVASQAAQLVAQTRTGSESIHGASQQFIQAGNALLGAVQEIRRVLDGARTQTAEQQALLVRQTDYTREVERLWPTLFDTYLEKFKVGADELGRSWEGFYQRVTQLTGTVNADFAENTERLGEAVDSLVKHLTSNRRATT